MWAAFCHPFDMTYIHDYCHVEIYGLFQVNRCDNYELGAIVRGETGLTYWGRETYTCVSKLTGIGSENGLAPTRCQTVIWTNAGILLIRTFGPNFCEILSGIHIFSFKKMHLKMPSGKWRPFCLGLNVFSAVCILCVGISCIRVIMRNSTIKSLI